MRIIFVRHGHPDYRKDCLTDLGNLQAAAAAKRLAHEGIQEIYSSTCGRALETAEHTAREIGITEIVKCDFMREISWGSIDGSEIYMKGHPWYTADHMIATGQNLLDTNWMTNELFSNNIVTNQVQDKAKAFDELLASFGYQRDGHFYRVNEDNYKTIAVFSHAGASSAVLSHFLNLPFPFLCSVMVPSLTGISVITLSGEKGTLVSPRVEIFNDAKHISGVAVTEEQKAAAQKRAFSL